MQVVPEWQLKSEIQQEIADLLGECFNGYPVGKTCLHQLPSFRVLGRRPEQLIAHMGVDYRLMNNGGKAIKVMGVSDFCVAMGRRRQQVGSQMLQFLERMADGAGVDFIMLIARDSGWYEQRGFKAVDNYVKWLMLHQGQSLGLGFRRLQGSLLVKPVSGLSWRDAPIDFMGNIF